MKPDNTLCHNFKHSLTPLQLFGVAWKLILTEMKWSFTYYFHRWETRQLRKRLRQEEERLGTLLLKHAQTNDTAYDKNTELGLALEQAGMLKDEIIYLQQEYQARRDLFVQERGYRYLDSKD
ncbi:hypothetical protein [Desulfonatronovibrio magnus]|uniref:hypothetical protein n=1 Tax=Desulfonatronovibrio magnus TaxID=698827 RepID=UPI0005EBD5B9|nr:hypothetical protein [Desulfonatronovibrio magnus]RQD66478.1 MAG: hypothetical protein D5R98_02605 [Desulfonatronovibrio sp. MSAO_Bac4]